MLLIVGVELYYAQVADGWKATSEGLLTGSAWHYPVLLFERTFGAYLQILLTVVGLALWGVLRHRTIGLSLILVPPFMSFMLRALLTFRASGSEMQNGSSIEMLHSAIQFSGQLLQALLLGPFGALVILILGIVAILTFALAGFYCCTKTPATISFAQFVSNLLIRMNTNLSTGIAEAQQACESQKGLALLCNALKLHVLRVLRNVMVGLSGAHSSTSGSVIELSITQRRIIAGISRLKGAIFLLCICLLGSWLFRGSPNEIFAFDLYFATATAATLIYVCKVHVAKENKAVSKSTSLPGVGILVAFVLCCGALAYRHALHLVAGVQANLFEISPLSFPGVVLLTVAAASVLFALLEARQLHRK